MAISCSGFNTIALFFHRIFKIDNAPVNTSLIIMLILFCGEDYGSVSWNSPIGDYQIVDWRVNILIQMEQFVRRHSDYSKRPPIHASGFSLLPPQFPCCYISLSSHASITLCAQPKPWCHAGSVFHNVFLTVDSVCNLFGNADKLEFFKWVGGSFQMSVAIKEIDCLPSYVCSYTHLIKIFLSCISRVVAMEITSILKQCCWIPHSDSLHALNAQILSLVDNKY